MLIHRADSLCDLPGITHGFFGRTGGVSTGLYASLNCGPGSDDDRAAVIENRRRVSTALGAELINVYQVHGADVAEVREAWPLGQGPKADAMVTTMPGLALGILTADCAPVLFAEPEARVIGAAHAGWKGAFSGVLEAVIAAMEALGAKRGQIRAAIGPAISQINYEVGAEFRDRFVDAAPDNARFFINADRPAHFRFDLTGYADARLAAAGLARIERLGACTYARETDFFSFRRQTHRGATEYGRQVSAIALTSHAATQI